jgi:threonine synthase
MNPTDKPRADSKLKTLAEDRQSQIADFATANTLADTVSWLQESGIETSSTAVSMFLSWYRLNQQVDRNETAVLTLLADLAKKDPSLSPERLFETGHQFFAASALEKQDPKAWYLVQQIALRKAHSQLESAKYHDNVEARKAAIQRELDAAKSTGGISPETLQKIERELNLC